MLQYTKHLIETFAIEFKALDIRHGKKYFEKTLYCRLEYVVSAERSILYDQQSLGKNTFVFVNSHKRHKTPNQPP